MPLLQTFANLAFVSLVYAETCSQVTTFAPSIKVSHKLSPSYTSTSNDYWSTTCAALDPSCVLYPSSADEVAAILNILHSNNETFAVKSGGHNPNNGFSSVQGGPLISTEHLNHVILDEKTGIVKFGPGNRWDDVAESLDGTGWSVVGGRIGNVGVGGYMLGGGLSFMTQERGWAASSILSYDLVLANGSTITPSATSHPDIFKALKGGGNNFGIVTSFTAQAYKQGDVHGGIMVFPRGKDTDGKMLKAIQEFVRNNKDDKAAIIPTAERAVWDLIDTWIIFTFYNGPKPPAGVFKVFEDLRPTVDTRRTRSYVDLVKANNVFVLKGSAYVIGTETIPLPANNSSSLSLEMLPEIHEHWRNVTESVDHLAGMISNIAYQPYPKRMAQLAQQSGGDMLDFDDSADRIIFELSYSFLVKSDYPEVDNALKETYGGIRDRVLGWQAEGRLEDVYLPLFMNDGFYRQDYFGRLKPENAALAKSLASELDPEGLFRERTGGFKP